MNGFFVIYNLAASIFTEQFVRIYYYQTCKNKKIPIVEVFSNDVWYSLVLDIKSLNSKQIKFFPIPSNCEWIFVNQTGRGYIKSDLLSSIFAEAMYNENFDKEVEPGDTTLKLIWEDGGGFYFFVEN